MLDKIRKYVIANKVEILILLVILLVGAFFRLYKISDYMTFLGDEGRDAIVAKDILRGDLTLLGPRASAGDFFLGPIYYYMMAPFLLLSGYDPVGPAIMVALFGIATIYLVFHTGRYFFSSKAGLIGASLYAVSPIVVAYSRSSWNPNPMPFFSLLMLFLLYIAVKNQNLKFFTIVGFLLGIAMQLHYLSTFLAVIIFFFVLLGGVIASKKNIFKRLTTGYAAIFIGFLVGFSPFLLFEVRHGFPNLRTIFSFIFTGSGDPGQALNYSFFGNMWDVFYRLFARLLTKFPPPEQINVSESLFLQAWMWATIILAIISIIMLLSHKNKLTVLLLGLWLFFGIFLFGFYRKSIYDYYLGFMFPLPFLLIGNLLSNIPMFSKRKSGVVITFVCVVLLLVLNLSGAPFLNPPNKQKDQAKTIAEFVLSKTNGKPFNFALLTNGNSDHVYRYFFETANSAPVTIQNYALDPERKSVTDQLLIVCEYTDCEPLGNSLWEVAGFGRAEIAGEWNITFMKVYRLTHYQRPENYRLENLKLDTRYENSDLGMSFLYPESFTINDNIRETGSNGSTTYLNLKLHTPEGGNEKSKEYQNNTMEIYMVVHKNSEEGNLGMSIKGRSIKDITNSNVPLNESIPSLINTSVPKEDSYVAENIGMGNLYWKLYIFSNQNYVYYLTMFGGIGGGYSPAAEELFDEIVDSIEFK